MATFMLARFSRRFSSGHLARGTMIAGVATLLGASKASAYLVGSIYFCFDLGLGLFFVTQGLGCGVEACLHFFVHANQVKWQSLPIF
jgi:hypothetical protein